MDILIKAFQKNPLSEKGGQFAFQTESGRYLNMQDKSNDELQGLASNLSPGIPMGHSSDNNSDPYHIPKANIMYYVKMFQENEKCQLEGLPPPHKIHEKLKFVRPIKRKVLIKEIMKQLEKENKLDNPNHVPLDKLDFGMDTKSMNKFLKGLSKKSMIDKQEKNWDLKETILSTCKTLKLSNNPEDKQKFLDAVRQLIFKDDQNMPSKTSSSTEDKEKFLAAITEFIYNDEDEISDTKMEQFEKKFDFKEDLSNDSGSDNSSIDSDSISNEGIKEENEKNFDKSPKIQLKKSSTINPFTGIKSDAIQGDMFNYNGELNVDNLLNRFAAGVGMLGQIKSSEKIQVYSDNNKKDEVSPNHDNENLITQSKIQKGISQNELRATLSMRNIDGSVYSRQKKDSLRKSVLFGSASTNNIIVKNENNSKGSQKNLTNLTPKYSGSKLPITSLKKLPDYKYIKQDNTSIQNNQVKTPRILPRGSFSEKHILRDTIMANSERLLNVKKQLDIPNNVSTLEGNLHTNRKKDFIIKTSKFADYLNNYKNVGNQQIHEGAKDSIVYQSQGIFKEMTWNLKGGAPVNSQLPQNNKNLVPYNKGYVTNPNFFHKSQKNIRKSCIMDNQNLTTTGLGMSPFSGRERRSLSTKRYYHLNKPFLIKK